MRRLRPGVNSPDDEQDRELPDGHGRGTPAYSQQAITRAIRLIASGARFVATNPDPTGPPPAGPRPATGAGLQTILVLSGITSRAEAERFPFLPSRIIASVADLVDGVPDRT